MVDCCRPSHYFLRCVVMAVFLFNAAITFAQGAVSDTIVDADGIVVRKLLPSAAYKRYPYGVTFLPENKLDSVFNYAATDLVPIIFKRDKTDLLLPNHALDSIVGVINRIVNDKDVDLAYVWIGGSASPEGPEDHNVWLGKTRAKRLYDYLKAHTSLPDSLIRIENLTEDWHTPLKLIQNNDFPNKERVLEIWSKEHSARQRKRKIIAIDNGETWEYLIDKMFRPARNARMVIVCTAQDSVATIRHYNPLKQLPKEIREIDKNQLSLATIVPTYRGQFVAIKTNLAALGLCVANLGAEFSFGNGFSLDLPVYYSPYDITSKFRVRILGTQPELRYWLRNDWPGEGHFFGVNGTVAGFDISFPNSNRFQDPEHALWGVGLSYGYALNFGAQKHWGLEFNIGAGYMNYHLDTFDNVHNGRLLYTKEKSFWGITRVGISLTYKFWRRKQTGYKILIKEDGK